MGYFDSPKNRALWEKELESLDMERKRRKEEGYRPESKGTASKISAKAKENENPKVRRITLKMLEEIEKASREEKKSAALKGQMTADRQDARTSMKGREKEQPQMSATL